MDAKVVKDAARVVRSKMIEASKAIFPSVNIRVELQAAFRFYKDDPESLHKFCERYKMPLDADVGDVIDPSTLS